MSALARFDIVRIASDSECPRRRQRKPGCCLDAYVELSPARSLRRTAAALFGYMCANREDDIEALKVKAIVERRAARFIYCALRQFCPGGPLDHRGRKIVPEGLQSTGASFRSRSRYESTTLSNSSLRSIIAQCPQS